MSSSPNTQHHSSQHHSEQLLTELRQPTVVPRRSCCTFGSITQSVATPLLSMVSVIAVCAAVFYAGRNSQLETLHQNSYPMLPLVNASASATAAEKYSVATGQVSEESEGFFVLDHNSGLLQCTVIYPRSGQFLGMFSVNVGEALGTSGKGGNYLLVTGQAAFPKASNRPAAPTIVYVLDTASGNYACYGVPFDRGMVAANRPQQKPMVLINTGSASAVPDRDQLR